MKPSVAREAGLVKARIPLQWCSSWGTIEGISQLARMSSMCAASNLV